MRLVRRSTLLTLLVGMRLLVSNAAADATQFKVISVDPSAQMSDLFSAAAKKLLRNTAYAALERGRRVCAGQVRGVRE